MRLFPIIYLFNLLCTTPSFLPPQFSTFHTHNINSANTPPTTATAISTSTAITPAAPDPDPPACALVDAVEDDEVVVDVVVAVLLFPSC
jgi:hypothetical protein